MAVWFKAAAGLALGLAQLWLIFALATHPHVSPIYRAFYISHTRDCWVPEADVTQIRTALAQSPQITPSTLPHTAGCYLLVKGWSGRDTSVTFQNTATLALPIPPGARTLTLDFTAPQPATPAINIYIGNILAGTSPIPGSITLNIPPRQTGDLGVEISTTAKTPVGLARISWAH